MGWSRAVGLALCLAAAAGCGAARAPAPGESSGVDSGGLVADAGGIDAGSPLDAGGAVDAGLPDSGSADGGAPDGGADGGTPDGGPDAGTPDGGPAALTPGGLGAGPWPQTPLTVYGSAQGLHEAPISVSVDESQNLWVVSHEALYLLRPGETRFHRFTASDGLHLGPGYTEYPDITLVEGGGPGECFVGYYAHDTHEPRDPGAHTANDPIAHMGKMDQVLLRADLTLEVRRYDLHNSNDPHYYETRTITSMVYDHFQHRGELYVGSNHGVTRIVPAKWRLPKTTAERSFPISVEREWYADHVHPWVCMGGPCPGRPSTFGDWYGLAMGDDGRLWMAGLTSAGAIGWTPGLQDWRNSWAPYNPFVPAFGDPYPGNPPVFLPPREGDYVNLRAVAPAPDGTVWFASGEVLADSWRGPTYGLAAWDGRQFTYVNPEAIGASEYNVLELLALPDGRLVLGFPSSGLLVWKPGDARGTRVTAGEGLPGQAIGRMFLDRMVSPWALYVPTDGGLAVFRKF
ncbi:MAG TPA: hypothetical protein VN883_01470 [Myxococcales bacterium]|nr:hypothetical protein [Myxococcales bacterium]